MQKKIIFIIWSVILVTASGQDGYFIKNGTITYGVEIARQSGVKNSKECHVISTNNVERYMPNEIQEYGWTGGRKFVSRQIALEDTTLLVFLECLVNGHISLYRYKGLGFQKFYVENDSAHLTELSKKGDGHTYTEQLTQITNNCEPLAAGISLVAYSTASLSKFVNRVNTCSVKYFPHFRFGVTVSYEILSLRATPAPEFNDLVQLNYDSNFGYAFGAFAEQPIMASNIAVRLALKFSQYAFTVNKLTESQDMDLVVNLHAVRIPLYIRYMLPSNKLRPFLLGGLITSYNYKNQSDYYVNKIHNNSILINPKATGQNLINNLQIGLGFGGGLEIDITKRVSIFFESEYNLYSTFNIKDQLKQNGLVFSTGFNF